MAKSRTLKTRKSRENAREIDHIPKFWQRPRSPGGARRRTDFSIFFSSYSLFNGPLGLLLESSSSKDKPTIDSIIELEQVRDKRKEILELPEVGCNNFLDKRGQIFSNVIEVPVVEAESATQNAVLEAWSSRDANKQESDIVSKLEYSPEKSQITNSSNICTTPGSTEWDKTAYQLWWPTEALHKSESQSLGKQCVGSSDDPNCSNRRDESPEKWNSSSSSRSESDCLERRRGKRQRKPKVHFDEVNFHLKSVRRVRRFRIMRFLGLAAPIGSPFSLTHI
ncbi:uncharacterized protein LOC127789519 [Diospyros lotus]|uniref:uncharacterized protein LOC127789519 n=1 Tax=Diospyros lotus TaxID=55363 RepID=UPI00225187B9|nr:uncharacterized protein LOC127789519 [Diospyros lotus]